MEMLMVIGRMTVDSAVWGDNIRRSQQQEVGGRREVETELPDQNRTDGIGSARLYRCTLYTNINTPHPSTHTWGHTSHISDRTLGPEHSVTSSVELTSEIKSYTLLQKIVNGGGWAGQGWARKWRKQGGEGEARRGGVWPGHGPQPV